ncbi:MAG: hypothetical protein A2X95_00095 [Syntrophobacterales bacterium GWF2_56_9]|nr:MAG: hypothetical protein A2X95_00095 [Syntrophobacterales bacterium GWF2_56_9]
MDRFSKEELKDLMTPTGEQCVSFFLPTHRTPPEAIQDPIRFRNMQKKAEERLIQGGLRRAEAKEFLAPLKKLSEDITFWQCQSDGLAVFLSRDLLRHFRVPVRFEELVVVARRFHLKPLIPLFTEDDGFFVLALSQNEIRLLRGNRFDATEVELENIPTSLFEALNYDDPERQLQFHTRNQTGMGRRAAVFYGHGVGIDDSKDNIRQYFFQIERGLRDVLRLERAPLILAGVDYLLPIYREVNTYPNLLEEAITGNPEGLHPEELHARAWEKVRPHFLKARNDMISQYKKLAGTGRTTREIKEILPAASQGRIEKLLVADGVQVWGNFFSDQGTVELNGKPTAGSEDLLDLAAIETILNGGMVYTVEPEALPDDSPIVALFRY